MKTYKRTTVNLVKSIIIAPFTMVLVYIIAHLLLPTQACIVLGAAAGAVLLYMAFFSENIYFELDDDGAFRYFKRGRQENGFALSVCRVGYRRKSESGIFGNHDINLQVLDGEGNETTIDAAPLGVKQFYEMFAEMEKHAIKDEPIRADNT